MRPVLAMATLADKLPSAFDVVLTVCHATASPGGGGGDAACVEEGGGSLVKKNVMVEWSEELQRYR